MQTLKLNLGIFPKLQGCQQSRHLSLLLHINLVEGKYVHILFQDMVCFYIFFIWGNLKDYHSIRSRTKYLFRMTINVKNLLNFIQFNSKVFIQSQIISHTCCSLQIRDFRHVKYLRNDLSHSHKNEGFGDWLYCLIT